MTDEAKNIAEKLNRTVVNRDELNRVLKDRLDFGFDSIYFRYAIVIDELAKYKEREKHQDMEHWANAQKMHFYNTLEKLVHAHEDSKWN